MKNKYKKQSTAESAREWEREAAQAEETGFFKFNLIKITMFSSNSHIKHQLFKHNYSVKQRSNVASI